jgi:hypothetical protein
MNFAHMIGKVLLRIAIAAAVSLAVGFFALLLGVIGGGGREGIMLSTVVGLFGAGWAVLPAVRQSLLLAAVAALGWAYLGYQLSLFGAQSVKGWMVGPWIIATVGVLLCLAVQPPAYFRPKETRHPDDSASPDA